jgi:hypothetical protein
MNRDLVSNILAGESIRPQVATGAVNGEEVDLRGFDSLAVVVSVGAIVGAAGDATVTLEESDTSGSGFTAVAAGDIQGAEPVLVANTAYQFGYIGTKRYVRAVFALGGETSVAVAAMVIAGHPAQAPTA